MNPPSADREVVGGGAGAFRGDRHARQGRG